MAISALQAVTTVNVLSSPQITVVDNQPARLQVGALVPYLTASSQSTLTANAHEPYVARYTYTSALSVQLLKSLAPALQPLLDGDEHSAILSSTARRE